jgi:selenocysteine lyase/cysteine desulfurase
MDREVTAREEERLYARLRGGLAAIPGIEFLDLWGAEHPHVGVVSFTLEGIATGLLATVLGAEYGIGVRQGAFCAHPLMAYITGGITTACDPTEGGAVRASFGLGTTDAHIDALLEAVRHIQANGPAWTYSFDPEHGYEPTPDPRVWPSGFWSN